MSLGKRQKSSQDSGLRVKPERVLRGGIVSLGINGTELLSSRGRDHRGNVRDSPQYPQGFQKANSEDGTDIICKKEKGGFQ